VWQVLGIGVTGLSLVGIALRTLAIARQPVHLRWELAPIPRDAAKGGQGSSHLEEFEWWSKPRRRFKTSTLIYMAREMFLLKCVWERNRPLWPLTLALHYGLYVTAGLFLGLAIHVVVLATGRDLLAAPLLRGGVSIVALLGYVLGSVGAIGLLLRRTLDPRLRLFTTVSRTVNLLVLAALFVSGGFAWISSASYAAEVARFAVGLITSDPRATVGLPLSLHLAVGALFLLYLPLTDMTHFIAKYFTYHRVRWDDRPQDARMQKELGTLLRQRVTWSASHIGSRGQKDWAEIAGAVARHEPRA
jgi:nitrate reductase gamma subunit